MPDADPGSGRRAFVRRNQVLAFVVLAYALSWWAWVWFRMDPENVGAPILPMGPLLAALILLPVIGGWPAVRDLLQRIARWRVGWAWYVVVAPVAGRAHARGRRPQSRCSARGASPDFAAPASATLAVRFVFILLWIGLGEEPVARLRAAAAARRPFGARRGADPRADPRGLAPPAVRRRVRRRQRPAWAITVVCFSIVVCWVYLHTGGSVLMAMLMHASNNTVALVWRMFEGGDQLRLWWLWCALWVAAAAVVVLANGADLTRSRPASA